MKKILVILFISLNAAIAQQPATTPVGPLPDYKKIAERIFEDIRKRDFSKASELFDTDFASRLDSTKLRNAWDKLQTISGPFVKIIETTLDHQPNYDVVLQHAQFEKKKIDFKVVFGTNQKVKGVSFLPGEPREAYKLPPYYKQDSVVEERLALKMGPLTLPGILTAPNRKGKFPVVIFVHGTGPNDKDESVGATKIFKDIAIGLSANGIASYRYDKRTRVQRAGTTKQKNFTVKDETMDDVSLAVETLKLDSLVDSTAIFLCGHSFGGMLLPRIAQQTKGISGLIFLAANARKLEDVMLDQTIYMLSLDTTGKDHTALVDSIKMENAKIKILKPSPNDSTRILFQPPSYWLDLNTYNPMNAVLSLNSPMLFMHGGRDYQTTEVDFNMWKKTLSGKKAEFKMYPDLNHFFIKGSEKSTPMEYNKSNNVDYDFIKDMSKWVLSVKK